MQCRLFKARLKTKTGSVQTGNYVLHCAKYRTATLHTAVHNKNEKAAIIPKEKYISAASTHQAVMQ